MSLWRATGGAASVVFAAAPDQAGVADHGAGDGESGVGAQGSERVRGVSGGAGAGAGKEGGQEGVGGGIRLVQARCAGKLNRLKQRLLEGLNGGGEKEKQAFG